MASNYKLLDTLQFVLPWVNFYPLTLGQTQQPFLGMCESVAEILVAPPLAPNWNRTSTQFLTTAGTQVYAPTAAWQLGTSYATGTVIVDTNGNGQQVIVAGTSGGSPPSWSTSIFASTTDNTVTWQNIGAIASIPQIFDFAYIETATIQDVNNGNKWKTLGVQLNLNREADQSCPKYIAAQIDDNLGNVAFWLTPVPGAVYPVDIQYQKLHQPFQSLGQTWAPIPDRLFYCYGFGVLALAMMYKGDPRFQWASQKFVTSVLSYYGGLDETQKNQFLMNWEMTLSDAVSMQKGQQAVAARSL